MRRTPSFRPPLSLAIPLPRVQEPIVRMVVEMEEATGIVKQDAEAGSNLACKPIAEARGAPGARRGTTRGSDVGEEAGWGHAIAGRTDTSTVAVSRTTTATTVAVSVPKQGTCTRWVQQATFPTRGSCPRHTRGVMVLPLRIWYRRILATCTASRQVGRRAATLIIPTPMRSRGMKKDTSLAGITRGRPRASPNVMTGAWRRRQATAVAAMSVVVFSGAKQARVREAGTSSHPEGGTSHAAAAAVAAGARAGAGTARDNAPQHFLGLFLSPLPPWMGGLERQERGLAQGSGAVGVGGRFIGGRCAFYFLAFCCYDTVICTRIVVVCLGV